jgi:serine/threonine protein kinase
VPEDWEPGRLLGTGAYGTVCAFDVAGKRLAVKKVTDVLSDCVKALRTLREIRLLAHLQHPNVLEVKELFVDGPQFKDAYLCLERMDGDLQRLIHGSSRYLEETQSQSIMFQITCGLLCLQTARIVHRDLKPSNVLVSAIGVVKLADFGLARSLEECSQQDCAALTEYVVTRYYRAPEIVLTATEYTYAVDVWSAGCILGEMFLRRPLFKGKDALDQIKRIVGALGDLSQEDDLCWIPQSSAASKFLQVCTVQNTKSTDELWRQLEKSPASPVAINLLREMLRFNPSSRITPRDILSHEYLGAFGGLDSEEAVAALRVVPVDWSFDSDLCYDEDGNPRELDDYLFRLKMLEAREEISKRSSAAKKDRTFSAKSQNENVPICPEPKSRSDEARLEAIEPVLKEFNGKSAPKKKSGIGGCCSKLGAPIAAVRRKIAL